MPQPEAPDIVLITGTTSGVGRALLHLYAQLNHTVIAVNRRDSQDVTLPGVLYFKCDITSLSEVQALIQNLSAKHLLPTIWILNAGINEVDNAAGIKIDVFRKVFDINLYGVLNFIHAFQSLSLKKAAVLAISSSSTIVPNSNHLGYYVSKISLNGVFKLLNRADPDNDYKLVLLGPTLTNLNRSAPEMKGIQKAIFYSLSLEAEEVALKIRRFAKTSELILHPSWRARIFYNLLSFTLKIFPGMYYKPYQKTGSERI